MNLKKALTLFADHVNLLGNTGGSVFCIAALDIDVRLYLLSRGLLVLEWEEGTDWERLTGRYWTPERAYLTPLGEREYERVLGADPYETQTSRRMRQYDREESARTIRILRSSARSVQRYQNSTMAQIVRARVAFYVGRDGQRPASTHEVI